MKLLPKRSLVSAVSNSVVNNRPHLYSFIGDFPMISISLGRGQLAKLDRGGQLSLTTSM